MENEEDTRIDEPTDELQTEEEAEERYVDEVHLVVPCPNCGHDCIWINDADADGWILCNAEAGSEEPEIHFCASPPDFISVDEEDEAEEENLVVT